MMSVRTARPMSAMNYFSIPKINAFYFNKFPLVVWRFSVLYISIASGAVFYSALIKTVVTFNSKIAQTSAA